MNQSKELGRRYSKKYRQSNKEKIREYDKNRRPRAKQYNKNIAQIRIEKGNKCSMCGYDENPKILHFHHLRDKIFILSERGRTLEEMRREAEKCILLCPNCHALTHLT